MHGAGGVPLVGAALRARYLPAGRGETFPSPLLLLLPRGDDVTSAQIQDGGQAACHVLPRHHQAQADKTLALLS